jgi:hypothetical protein
MTDGAESLLRVKKLLPVLTRPVLDYFHVAMKVRHIDQCIGRIPPYAFAPAGSVFKLYDRFNYLRGYLWSGRRANLKSHPTASCIYWIECERNCRSQNERRAWPVGTYANLGAIYARTRQASSTIASGGEQDAEFQPAQWKAQSIG